MIIIYRISQKQKDNQEKKAKLRDRELDNKT